LKDRRKQKRSEDEEENLSSYSITSRTIEDTGTLKKKHYKALCAELPMEGATDF